MNLTKNPTKTVEDVRVLSAHNPVTCSFCLERYQFKVEVFSRGDDGTGYVGDIFVCEKHFPKPGDRL